MYQSQPFDLNRTHGVRWAIAINVLTLTFGAHARAADNPDTRPSPKLVPFTQVIPQPYEQASFQRDGTEVARYHFGSALRRPFVFPLIGPSGRSVTRMGHPRDPVGHSHHNSVWVAHADVNGLSFWDDRQKGRIVHQRLEAYRDGEDAPDESSVTATSHWIDERDPAKSAVMLIERRRTTVKVLDGGELLLILDIELEAPKDKPATLGKTPFGLVGVRMAKTIGVHDGGGTIRNSEGGVNEPAIFWKPAKWVDYSGPITPKAVEGATLFDHPGNPNHPAVFHVRGDGWMGASLTFGGPMTIEPGKPLRLRYAVWVHAGMPELAAIEKRWSEFAKMPVPETLIPPKEK